MSRRVPILADNLARQIAEPGSLLDVGCGDGGVTADVAQRVPGLRVEGIDVLARPRCAIPMQIYDGHRFPFGDRSFDFVLFTDVLHHTPDPLGLLREARRVARRAILIKDHLCESGWDDRVLRIMDWVGNRPHGIVLPYNYWSGRQWRAAWKELGLAPVQYSTRLGLYPAVFRPLFESGLHFMARLEPAC
jgi:SAM-dependent methyltransferase